MVVVDYNSVLSELIFQKSYHIEEGHTRRLFLAAGQKKAEQPRTATRDACPVRQAELYGVWPVVVWRLNYDLLYDDII